MLGGTSCPQDSESQNNYVGPERLRKLSWLSSPHRGLEGVWDLYLFQCLNPTSPKIQILLNSSTESWVFAVIYSIHLISTKTDTIPNRQCMGSKGRETSRFWHSSCCKPKKSKLGGTDKIYEIKLPFLSYTSNTTLTSLDCMHAVHQESRTNTSNVYINFLCIYSNTKRGLVSQILVLLGKEIL